MAFTDLLPERPLTQKEFRALERNENIDSLETDDTEGTVSTFTVAIGDSEANYHFAPGMGWHTHAGGGHHH